jgi:hypothetical protein
MACKTVSTFPVRICPGKYFIDGVEGDKVEDTESVFYGKRMRHGWKNSAPWVYSYDPEKIILSEIVPEARANHRVNPINASGGTDGSSPCARKAKRIRSGQ